MNETNLAAGEGEQETGISVDLDASDPSKAVTRDRVRTAPRQRAPTWAAERAETSKEVQKRLQRMQRNFDQRLAEQQADFQRQLAERDKRLNGLERAPSDTGTSDDAKHEAAMAEMQGRLEEAQERGDSKEVAKITAEMSRAEGKYWALKAAKQGVTDKPNGTAATTAATGTTEQPRTQGSTKAGIAWARVNGDWWNDTVDESAIDARDYANRLYKRMLADGQDDPEDAAFFEKIGELVARRFPEIEIKKVGGKRRPAAIDDDFDDADGQDDDASQHRNPRRAAPAMLPNRGEPTRTQRGRSLTREDMRVMRETGMDPNNNAHVVQYMKAGAEMESEA